MSTGKYILLLHPPGIHIAACHHHTVDSQKDQIDADDEACGKQSYGRPDDHETAQDDSKNIYDHSKVTEKFSCQADQREVGQSGNGMGDEPDWEKQGHDQFSGVWIHQKH